MSTAALNKGAIALSKIFCADGHVLYLVGGAVRNIVLGLSEGDFDVCSAMLPHQAGELLRRAGLTVIEKALSLGTIEAHLTLNGTKYVFEHTTFRRDFYPHGGEHRPYKVEFTDDIASDARRRDFTMNALYIDIAQNMIIDPTGSGRGDIENKTIRAAASDPSETIGDDGLRIMRMARFAAELGFSVADDLFACARQNAALLQDISAERKCAELKKILMADTVYDLPKNDTPAHLRGLQILRDIGAMPYILPRLAEGDGVVQSKKYHAHDVLGHGISTCAAAPPVLPLRLAALMHDIGKPRALALGGNMYGHETLGETLARDELNGLKFDNKTKRTVLALIKNHMFDLNGKAKPKTIRKHAVLMGEEIFRMLIDLRRADFAGSGKKIGDVRSADNWASELERMREQAVPWRVQDLKITGTEVAKVLGIVPSPKIGRILDSLFWECVMRPGQNTPEMLKRRAKALEGNV